MQDSHLLVCPATNLASRSRYGQLVARKGTSTVLTARADGVCGQSKFRLSSTPWNGNVCMWIWVLELLQTSEMRARWCHQDISGYREVFCIFSQVTILRFKTTWLAAIKNDGFSTSLCLGRANMQVISKHMLVLNRRLACPWTRMTPASIYCKTLVKITMIFPFKMMGLV